MPKKSQSKKVSKMRLSRKISNRKKSNNSKKGKLVKGNYKKGGARRKKKKRISLRKMRGGTAKQPTGTGWDTVFIYEKAGNMSTAAEMHTKMRNFLIAYDTYGFTIYKSPAAARGGENRFKLLLLTSHSTEKTLEYLLNFDGTSQDIDLTTPGQIKIPTTMNFEDFINNFVKIEMNYLYGINQPNFNNMYQSDDTYKSFKSPSTFKPYEYLQYFEANEVLPISKSDYHTSWDNDKKNKDSLPSIINKIKSKGHGIKGTYLIRFDTDTEEFRLILVTNTNPNVQVLEYRIVVDDIIYTDGGINYDQPGVIKIKSDLTLGDFEDNYTTSYLYMKSVSGSKQIMTNTPFKIEEQPNLKRFDNNEDKNAFVDTEKYSNDDLSKVLFEPSPAEKVINMNNGQGLAHLKYLNKVLIGNIKIPIPKSDESKEYKFIKLTTGDIQNFEDLCIMVDATKTKEEETFGISTEPDQEFLAYIPQNIHNIGMGNTGQAYLKERKISEKYTASERTSKKKEIDKRLVDRTEKVGTDDEEPSMVTINQKIAILWLIRSIEEKIGGYDNLIREIQYLKFQILNYKYMGEGNDKFYPEE